VLVVGWFSPLHGEATAGDLLAARTVTASLEGYGVAFDLAWSPTLRPDGPALADCPPERYSHLVFVCGPVHGSVIVDLHRRYASLYRIAVGVSVPDPDDRAVRGFDVVIARDAPHVPGRRDLAAAAVTVPTRVRAPGSIPSAPPVVGVVLSRRQDEYADRSLHTAVTRSLAGWLAHRPLAPVVLDTRIDTRDGLLCADVEQFLAVLGRVDLVVTTRLHGLVLGLASRLPVLVVDPVARGAKVSAQAAAWDWPVLAGERVAGRPVPERDAVLDAALRWCLSPLGGAGVERCAARAREAGADQLADLADALGLPRSGPPSDAASEPA